MRQVHGHEGSTLNNATQIFCEDRNDNGGSHNYYVEIHSPERGTQMFNLPPFQNGPVQEAGLNGISDEVLIAVVIDRLEGFNSGPYRCRENSLAITKLEEALHWLQHRTSVRQRRGVEGTHTV